MSRQYKDCIQCIDKENDFVVRIFVEETNAEFDFELTDILIFIKYFLRHN